MVAKTKGGTSLMLLQALLLNSSVSHLRYFICTHIIFVAYLSLPSRRSLNFYCLSHHALHGPHLQIFSICFFSFVVLFSRIYFSFSLSASHPPSAKWDILNFKFWKYELIFFNQYCIDSRKRKIGPQDQRERERERKEAQKRERECNKDKDVLLIECHECNAVIISFTTHLSLVIKE